MSGYKKSKYFLLLIITFVSFFNYVLPPPMAFGAGGININLVAANASSTETKKVPVTYFLPKELTTEDVINTGGLELDYDIDKSAYYLKGMVELAPKESKTIKIEVKDVWKVTPEEVDTLKKQIEDNLSTLKNSQYYESGKILRDNMLEKLDYILQQQASYAENVERRIEEYRAYVDDINAIRKNAFSADYFKTSSSAATEGKTVKFIIEVKNPSDKETKKVKQQHCLPLEVRSEHVVDAQGFEVRFDEKKGQSCLAKEEELKPSETKRYEIVLKDIWNIAPENIETLRKRADVSFEGVKNSEYAQGAQYLYDLIVEALDKIENSQNEKTNMKQYIGAYRTNKRLFEESEENIIKLEMMLASVKAEKLEELESGKVKNVLQKMQALRGIMGISQAVFGKKPSVTNTWKVIWGILIFVAIFTAIHFFTWWRKSQVMGEEMAMKTRGVIKEVTPPTPQPEKK